jgi:hypothetical protein
MQMLVVLNLPSHQQYVMQQIADEQSSQLASDKEARTKQ